MNKHVNLDIIRIFAAWLVLSVHVGQFSGIDFSVGANGVQLFFVLSGYLAFVSLDKNASVISYYRRRLIRIIPIYWTCLVISYIEEIILGIYSSSLEDVLAGQCGPMYLRYFVFWQCFTPTNNWDLWNNYGALWTMSSFIGFYILAPYLYRIMKNFYISIFFLTVALFSRSYLVSWIQNIFSGYPEEAHIEWFASMNPLTEFYCFLLGAVLFVAIKEKKQNIYQGMVAIVLTITALSWYPYELLFVLFIGISVLSNPATDNNKICKYISRISEGSFALYLIHPMVLRIAPIIGRKIGIENRWLYMIYLYALCIGVTYILYYKFIVRIEKYLRNALIKN